MLQTIKGFELNNNELIIYRVQEDVELDIQELSDPSVTRTDMYAYGYGYEGMIPFGRDRALELFNEGRMVFLLGQDDTERVANSRENITAFDGMFGVLDPEKSKETRSASIEVFILNRERYESGQAVGEWLTLPASADTLRGLLERVGVDRPSEGAFSVAAIRLPYDCLSDHVTKYDSLDELNMLASYMINTEDYELDKLQAILTSGVMDIGKGAAALINVLDEDNLDAFNIIDAKDAGELGRYWEEDKPRGVSLAEYGRQIMREDKGVFTDWGYIYFRYKELSPAYTGDVPNEYRIIGDALRVLCPVTPDREQPDKRPSVVDQIKAARQTPRVPADRDAQKPKRDKGGPEL